MSHRLEPHAGQAYLDPREVATRLQEEFSCCDIDAEQGMDDAGDMLAKLIELKAPQAIIDEVSAGREHSLRVTVADDNASDNYLSFLVRPNNGLLIGYYSATHERTCRPMLERCATALNYQITLV